MKKSWRWTEDGFTVTRSICWSAPGCHGGCGVLLYTKDGRLVKVEGDTENPFNQGRMCARGLATKHTVYHPDRILSPLKRRGPRGSNQWQSISWDEAYQTIETELGQIKSRYGPEAVIFCKGTGRDIGPYLSRLAHAFGSPNYFALGPANGNACLMPRMSTCFAMLGDYVVADCSQYFPDRYDSPQWRLPKCILIWGSNPVYTNPDGFFGAWILDCMKKGSQLIVIDPKMTWLASRAKHWLQVRPGTDSALALGFLNVIIKESLYEKEMVDQWTHGFDALRQRVEDYTPSRVAEITWVPEERIVDAARLYAKSKPAACQWGVGIEMTNECIGTVQALVCLWAVTGNIDKPGSMVVARDPFDIPRRGPSSELGSKRIGIDHYPMFQYSIPYGQGDALLEQLASGKPYPIKSAWIQACGTIVSSFAHPSDAFAAFRALDFVVAVDLFVTPTAVAFADIVLPATTFPERNGIRNWWYQLATINQAITPCGQCRSDMQIVLEIGKRLNKEAFPWRTDTEMFTAMIAASGMSFEDLREAGPVMPGIAYERFRSGKLRPDGQPGFNTPTGKIELFAKRLQEIGLDPLPSFQEPLESPYAKPTLATQYPLILITGGRVPAFFHSEHRNVKALRRLNPHPLLECHPDPADREGLRDGDNVWVESPRGRALFCLSITEAVDARVVHAQHGWWFPEREGNEPELFGVWESNINCLIPSGAVGPSGLGYPFRSTLCRIYKA